MFKKALIAFVTTAAIALAPASVSARGGFGGGGFHGGGWRGGFGPALAGGFIAGAVIGGLASSAYAWGPGYGYYGGYYPGPAYGYYDDPGCPQPGYGAYYNCGSYAVPGYGGYAPVYYGYGPGPW